MLTCPTHLPIYFCTQPVDFRRSTVNRTRLTRAQRRLANAKSKTPAEPHEVPIIERRPALK
ncbi:MAG: hypothetical protein ACK57O_05395, partial [Planctomyces sp.]